MQLISEEQYQEEFVAYLEQYEKTYDVNEFFSRFNNFKHSYDTMLRHNAGNHSWYQISTDFVLFKPSVVRRLTLVSALCAGPWASTSSAISPSRSSPPST